MILVLLDDIPNDHPQRNGANEQSNEPPDDDRQRLYVKGESLCMRGAAPYARQKPEREGRIEETGDDSEGRRQEYDAESLAKE